MNCEICKEKDSKYYCIKCNKNICNICFEYHKEHKYYNFIDYLSANEIKEIKNNFDKSEKNIKNNINLIEKKINEFEIQLNELKKLYENYKDINNKLIKFGKYIFNSYTKLSEEKKLIYYSIYFNIKNLFIFNPHQIQLPKDDISIKSFTKILYDKIVSGFYYIFQNSNYSDNLSDYNNLEKIFINYNSIDIYKLNKVETKYNSVELFKDNKIFGYYTNKENDNYQDIQDNEDNNDFHISNNKPNFKLDIYNIKYKKIETSLSFSPTKIFYNQEYNTLIFFSKFYLYIINPKTFSIIQEIISDPSNEIKINKKSKEESDIWGHNRNNNSREILGTFINVIFFNKNSFGVIFKGNISHLGEEYISLINFDDIKPINNKDSYFHKKDCEDFSYLIIYQKDKEVFFPKKIILLIKDKIMTNNVDYVTGKYCELDIDQYGGDLYCSFKLDSIIKLSNDELIIAYKSKIEANRNQDYYYIIDEEYKDEIIYYYLNIKKSKKIEKRIGSTSENSFLIKNDNEGNYYFLYNDSISFAESLKEMFNHKKLVLKSVKINNNLKFRKLFFQKNTVIGYNEKNIYFGKIINNNLEIISIYKNDEIKEILFVSLDDNCILYKKDKSKDDNKTFNNTKIEQFFHFN